MKKIILFFSLLLITFYMRAQVPVSKEPRHHVVFENEKVRLLNVLLPPGDTTQYHVHSTPSVFICFTKTNTTSQLIHQQPVQSTSNAGYIWFENLKPPHIKIHRVWNQDTAAFHVMDIEVLSNDSRFTQKPILLPHTQLTIDTPWARTYKIELAKSEQVTIEEHPSAFVLIAINNGTITMIKKGAGNNLDLQAGTFFWIKPDEQFTLLNQSDTVTHFALVEIR
ncbi:MAG: hypothetical protein WKG06_12600 [Segetibacter sp.]